MTVFKERTHNFDAIMTHIMLNTSINNPIKDNPLKDKILSEFLLQWLKEYLAQNKLKLQFRVIL
jgi:hypothetical protein